MDSYIITLYKNKRGLGDCNNYRRISLLSAVGEIVARIILTRLQTLPNGCTLTHSVVSAQVEEL